MESGWLVDPTLAPHRVLQTEDGPLAEVKDAALVEVDGRTVLVLTGLGEEHEELIGALDLETGAHLPDRSGLQQSSPYAVALGAGVLATIGRPGRVTVRDAATGGAVRVLEHPQDATSMLAIGVLEGRAVVFARRDVVDVETGRLIATRGTLAEDYQATGHFVAYGGRMLIAAHRTGGGTRLFDAITGEAFGAPFGAHARSPEELVAVEYEGRLVVASRDRRWGAGRVLLWDGESGTAVLTPPVEEVACFALALVEGRPLLLVGHTTDAEPRLTLWDPTTASAVQPDFFAGYGQSPETVALGSLEGGFAAVVIGDGPRDERAELWTSRADGRRRVTLGEVGTGGLVLGLVEGRPTIVLSSEKGALRLFDAATAEEFAGPFYGGRLREDCLAGGVIDGRGVAVLVGFPTRVWDLGTGVPVARLDHFSGHWQRVAVGELAGRGVLAVVAEGRLTVWDVAASEVVCEVHRDLDHEAGVVFTQIGGRTAVTASTGGEVCSWDAATGEPTGRPGPIDSRAQSLVAGLVGDRWVVFVGDSDGRIRAQDPATGADVVPPMSGHHDRVEALAFAAVDGRAVLVSGSYDNTVRVWDAATGEAIGEPLNGHGSEITSVHLTRYQGSPVVVSTSRQGAPRMWMLQAEPVDAGHTASVRDICAGLLCGTTVFASASADQTVRLWSATTGRPVGAALTGHDEPVTALTFAGPERDLLFTADASGRVLRWSADGPELRSSPWARLEGAVVSLAVADVDGRSVVGAATAGGAFAMWDAVTAEPYAALSTDGIRTADLGVLDGRLVAVTVGPNDWPEGIVTVWDVESGTPLHAPVAVPEESDTLGTFGVVDGRLVLVQGIDGEQDDDGYDPYDAANVCVYDATTGTVLATLQNEFHFNAEAVVAGSLVLVASDQGVVVMDPHTGASIAPPYTAHAADLTCVAAAEVDGRTVVASGDLGNGVHVWDLETRRRLS